MKILSAKYTDADQTYVEVETPSGPRVVNADPLNSAFGIVLDWVRDGNQIEECLPRDVSVGEVKVERQRRISLIADPDKQAYFQRLMISWLEQGKETWTPEQIAQVAAIRAGNQAIDVIVAKASSLEAMEPIPTDYTDDKWWS